MSPVPYSIYTSQPRCASSALVWGPWAISENLQNSYRNNGTFIEFSCPRTLPYQPIISIPAEALRIDPGWAECIGGFDGVFDPPIALTPKDAIATPTAPPSKVDGPLLTSTAMPASTPRPVLAASTHSLPSYTTLRTSSLVHVQHSSVDSIDAEGDSVPQTANGGEFDPSSSSSRTQLSQIPSLSRSDQVLPSQTAGVSTTPPLSATRLPGDGDVSNGAPSHDSFEYSRVDTADTGLDRNTDALSILLVAQSPLDAESSQAAHTRFLKSAKIYSSQLEDPSS